MRESAAKLDPALVRAAAVMASVLFLYASVLAKLGRDWWNDENYSHGLLVPFVIGLILWQSWREIRKNTAPSAIAGGALVVVALLMLFAGTLGAELFTQRMSLVVMLAGLVLYFAGVRMLRLLAVPIALLVLAIPIPQILFNKLAFPLQIWASQVAVWGIRLFEVPVLRNGNVIDILPKGSTQTISLEVVEACSGIRSMVTLITLALILGYFTRRSEGVGLFGRDLFRALLLMAAAVPIAVLTNSARVIGTGVMTYHYGRRATEAAIHDASGWLVYIVALLMLLGLNVAILKIFGEPRPR